MVSVFSFEEISKTDNTAMDPELTIYANPARLMKWDTLFNCYNYLYLQVNSLLLFTSHNTIACILFEQECHLH